MTTSSPDRQTSMPLEPAFRAADHAPGNAGQAARRKADGPEMPLVPGLPAEILPCRPGERLGARRSRLAKAKAELRDQLEAERRRVRAERQQAMEAAKETVKERRLEKQAAKEAAKEGVRQRKAARKPLARLTAALAGALASAGSLDDEVEALVASLDDRGRDLLLRRWGYLEWPAPTLQSMGEKHNVTRERMRQIEALHESRLREVEPVLPLARRAADLLSSMGGAVPQEAFLATLHDQGITGTAEALRVLPRLAELGLVPPLTFHGESQIWLDTAQRDALLATSEFDAMLHRMLLQARRAIRRSGVVSTTRLSMAPPISVEHAAALVLDGRPWGIHSGYVVPDQGEESVLTRACALMLTVTPQLALDDIRQSLRRLVPRAIKLPINVIAEVLKHHPAFVVSRGMAALREPDASRVEFRPAETSIIRAMEARGGYLTVPEINAVLIAGDFNTSWILPITKSPWVIKISPSTYGLIGRPVPAAATRPPTGDGPRPYEQVLVHGRHEAEAGLFHLRFRATPVSLRGALRLPNRVASALESIAGDWPVRTGTATEASSPGAALPSGDEGAVDALPMTLSVRSGLLWDVSQWMDAAGIDVGDHIAATLDLSARHVVLARVPADQAAADEARWQAVRAAQFTETRSSRHRLRWDTDGAEQLRRRAERRRRAEERRQARQERLAHQAEERQRLAAERAARHEARLAAGEAVELEVDATLAGAVELDWARVRVIYVEDVDPDYGDALVTIYEDFPLAPGTCGVAMGVMARLDAPRGKRKFIPGLIELHLLARGRPSDREEALLLLPSLQQVLEHHRAALRWREYRSPQSELLVAHIGG